MFYVGVDLGQRKDYSAIAIVERTESLRQEFDAVWWRPGMRGVVEAALCDLEVLRIE